MTNTDTKPDEQKSDNAARRLARLAAVQGLYQIALSQETPETLVRRFHENPSVLLQEERAVIAVDEALFSKIVLGAAKHQPNLDRMLAGAVDSGLSADRLELLLKSILRAGIFELLYNSEVAEGIIVNDYVEVTHGFFGGKEPALVNALLDRLAKTIRS